MHPAAAWRPVGTILVENGSITQEQLDAALAEQARTGRRLGEILTTSGAITWLTLAYAIAEQAADLSPSPPARPEPPAPTPEPVVAPPAAPAADDDAAQGPASVEAVLTDRQRAFLELASVTETLGAALARLQEELVTRNHELAKSGAKPST
jgi:hypothetical protein